MNIQIFIAFVFLGILSTLAGMYIMAYLGGWTDLAKQFPATELPLTKAYRFCTGSVGMASYGGCLTLRVADTGLHISAGLFGIPLLLWHPPLLIPWSEFHSTKKRTFIFWTSTVTVTYVGMPVIAQMTLPGWVYDHIESENQPTQDDHGAVSTPV